MTTDDKKKRISELEKAVESLLIAIVRETSSLQFYEKLLEIHKGSSTGDIFRDLAQGEEAHKNELEKKIDELQKELDILKRS